MDANWVPVSLLGWLWEEGDTFDTSCAPFLEQFIQTARLCGARGRLRLAGRSGTSAVYEGIDFEIDLGGGTTINQDRLSFGQKRLLSFFYYLDVHPHAVVADELVNGMHHAWIAACVEALGDRQAFLVSQNPLLLDHLTFESAEDVRTTFIRCERRLEDGRGTFLWRNFTEEEAGDVFAAYEVGIQHASEILRDQGLW